MPRAKKRKYVRRKPYPEVPVHMQAKPEGNVVDLLGYLMDVDDIVSRTMMPYIVIGELAKQIREEVEHPMGNRIDLIVKKREYSQHAYDTLSLFVPGLKKEDNVIRFEVKGVPVTIRIVDKKYRFFENPDTRFFYTGNFLVPNPFDMYWEVRDVWS